MEVYNSIIIIMQTKFSNVFTHFTSGTLPVLVWIFLTSTVGRLLAYCQTLRSWERIVPRSGNPFYPFKSISGPIFSLLVRLTQQSQRPLWVIWIPRELTVIQLSHWGMSS